MIEQQILKRLKGYTEAFYRKDFDTVIEYLHPDDIKTLRANMEWMAKAMHPFGETVSFLRLFEGIDTLSELSTLTDKEFITIFFAPATQKVSNEQIEDLVNSLEITEVDHAEYIANVKYSFENVFNEIDIRIESEVNLILSEGQWFVLFNPNMDSTFDNYRKQIDNYQDAKSKDNPDLANTPDDQIEVFEVRGYRNMDNEIIIHPRFKEAYDFRQGLAPVRIFNKWAYINKKGDLAVKPQFDRAFPFYEGLAMVGIQSDDFYYLNGFINLKGELVIPLQYTDARFYSEGLVAVCQDEKWGYIDKKGNIVLAFQYDSANDFKNGKAVVEVDERFLAIDRQGNILEELEDYWEDDEDDDWDEGLPF